MKRHTLDLYLLLMLQIAITVVSVQQLGNYQSQTSLLQLVTGNLSRFLSNNS